MQPFPDFGTMLTFGEGVKSDTGSRKGIVNVPTKEEYASMLQVYRFIYLPLCVHFGKLPVSSFFRCVRLNKAVGGAVNSQHTRGEAIDIDCDSLKNLTNRQLFDYVKAYMDFDQIGLEYPDKNGNPGWVHISYVSPEKNRKSQFTAI